jgi:hypothetical protein
MLSAKSVNVLHLLLIGPYLTYVGLYGRKCNPLCFKLLAALGLLVMVFHGYRLYIEMGKKVSPESLGTAMTNTINNVKQQVIGRDNNGNNVVVDEEGNVAVVNNNGDVVAMNDENASESANQAMANNAANNAGNNVM